MISLEYSFPGIPRAGSSLFLLLSDPPYFKTHPWSDPRTAFYNVTLSPDFASWRCLGQGPVHRTFSRIHPQKCFSAFPRNSSWFSTHSYSGKFGSPSPSYALSRHPGAYESVTEGQSVGAVPDLHLSLYIPSSRANCNAWAWILGCS